MSRDQLIDRGRGALELRKSDEVQDRGKNLGRVETHEQEDPERRYQCGVGNMIRVMSGHWIGDTLARYNET